MANCPSCQSSNTKTVQMAWASGLRNNSRSTTGGGITSRGTIGLGASSSRGVSQSAISAACAPPKPKGLSPKVAGVLTWLAIILLLGSPVSANSGGGFFTSLWTIVTMFGGVYAGYRVYKHLEAKRIEQLREYASQWICLRCGTTYNP